jgi:serine/threonine-protein kinase
VLSSKDRLCPACGVSLDAETALLPPDPSAETPTKLETPLKRPDTPVTTTTGVSGQFVSGTVLAGRYRIVGLIGKGGMGEVYKAEDLELEQTVALKFLPEEVAKNEELLRRFRGEVRNARQVSHRNVCRVFDIGETDGLYYLTMEYIDGDDLSILLKRIGRFSSDRAVEISRQISMGLAAIHKAGILHRDLKPANIIIDSKGEARITDFGIAGLEAEVQGVESRVGTPAYMSPEQADGKELTKQSDIYSLGLLLYEIFTGKQAYEGESVQELRVKHATTSPKHPSEIVAGIDPLVEKIIDRCLEKDPKDRPDSALSVAMSLPGGNPLQVALEAGETPTPDMVAAAPVEGVLKPWMALGMFAFVMAVFGLTIYIVSTYADSGLTPFERSPEALAERARTIVRGFGYTDRPADSDHKILPDPVYKEYAKTQANPSEWWKRIEKGQPFHYYFFYRESPTTLDPINGSNIIGPNDPPITEPGMINVMLDVKGRLIQFKAVPPARVPEEASTEKPDWQKVFNEAGLDQAKFEEVSPELNPTLFADEIHEWKGTLSDYPDIPLRVRAAALNGKLVEFRAVPVWKEPSAAAGPAGNATGSSWYMILSAVMTLTIFLGAIFLAYFNWKKGRTDLSGAVKLAFFVFLLNFLSSFIVSDHLSLFGLMNNTITSIAPSALNFALITSVFYLALEPFVRKYWPEVLISWNRMLKGDLRNPLIGRDILAGFFLFAIFQAISIGVQFLVVKLDPALFLVGITSGNYLPLNGFAYSVGLLWGVMWNSLFAAFWFLSGLILGFLIFKKKSIAFTALFLLLSLQTIGDVIDGDVAGRYEFLFVWSVFNVLCWFAVMRFGLVAVWALLLVYYVSFFTLTIDTSRHYFSSTVLFASTILVIAGYACYISMGNQSGRAWLRDDKPNT